jgi:UPF0755 protein
MVGLIGGIFFPKEKEGKEQLVVIERGMGVGEIAQTLEKKGLIWHRFLFELYVFLTGKAGQLQAGSYFLSSSLNLPQLVKKLTQGEVAEIKITIPEGLKLKEIEKLLNAKLHQPIDLASLKLKDFQEDFAFLKKAPSEATLEGFLFPDTYYFKIEPVKKIAQKFLKNFEHKAIKKMGPEISEKDFYSLLIMASLLEKEVKTLEDKKLVAGILWKRLKNQIPLQVDATITYITGKKTVKITLAETQIDHPYNTYKYLGLPPGPICNPGLESIIAAKYPKSSPHWYYLSTPEGRTIFSKTLSEHNLAKARYLK